MASSLAARTASAGGGRRGLGAMRLRLALATAHQTAPLKNLHGRGGVVPSSSPLAALTTRSRSGATAPLPSSRAARS